VWCPSKWLASVQLFFVIGMCCGSVTTVKSQCDTLTGAIPLDLDSVAVFQYNSAGGTDCWGWAATDGTLYAIYGAIDGIAFINVSSMAESDFVPSESDCWSRDMQAYGHYCYVVSECGTALQIFDLQYLPDSVSLVNTHIAGGMSCHNLAIDTSRGFAYLANPGRTGFRVLDLADPVNPVELAGVLTGDLHDVFARNDTVWVPEGTRGTFSCWDMSNKQAPELIVRVGIPNAGYVHDAQWSPDGRILATVEETPGKTIKLWDLEDLENVSLVSEFLGPNNYAHNAHFWGELLFVSHYDAGVRVYDISSPGCPVEVAFYDTHPAHDLPNGSGCWGVFPYTGDSGLLFASNRDGKLFVFHHDTAVVDIEAAPRTGHAPLNVDFDGYSSGGSPTWQWAFGDGEYSDLEDPEHTYQAGVYDVSLDVTSSLGSHSEFEPAYVIAVAETLKVSDTITSPSTSVVLAVAINNHVTIDEMTLPIVVGNLTWAIVDSVNTSGCRTAYFERKQLLFSLLNQGKYAVRLTANVGGGSPALPPGQGPILKVYLTVKSGTPNGTVIPVSVIENNGTSPGMRTNTFSFSPDTVSGKVTVYTASAQFTGSPRFGPAPLSTSFTSQSGPATSWHWIFGDGDSSTFANPLHTFAAGTYDVELQTASVVGPASLTKTQYVTAYAETLKVRDTAADVGTPVVWNISLTNHVPISQLVLPILVSGIPSRAILDSIVTTTGRLGYFESHTLTYDHRDFGSMAFRLIADAGGGAPSLVPGHGVIAQIFLRIKPTAVPGNVLELYMPTLGPNVLQATTIGGTLIPALTSGSITLTGIQACECQCHGDPVCDGAVDVQDVVLTINTAFRGTASVADPLCPHSARTDINCSGATDVIDVVRIIDVAFRGVAAASAICNPCS